ncbi:MAG: hypothetical protein ACK5KR_08235 [Breznakia sp.]
MNKVFKRLHKRLDHPLDTDQAYKKKLQQMHLAFQRVHLDYAQKNILSFLYNEIIYQGILNKQAIERAYAEAKNMMNDNYQSLDYSEKRRLLTYETQLVAHCLPNQKIQNQNIYIPFFNEEWNRIYDDEMVLFDLKKYQNYIDDFKDIMVNKHYYGHIFLNPKFCSGEIFYEKDDFFAVMFYMQHCLYFYHGNSELCHISLPRDTSRDILAHIAILFFEQNEKTFIEYILQLVALKERDKKYILKQLAKVPS